MVWLLTPSPALRYVPMSIVQGYIFDQTYVVKLPKGAYFFEALPGKDIDLNCSFQIVQVRDSDWMSNISNKSGVGF